MTFYLFKIKLSLMWEFVKSASKVSEAPTQVTAEVCFIGRSNVGKSSIINAVTMHRGLAIVSREPGRTRLLNYFFDASTSQTLVDLPGYGFAKAGKAHQGAMSELVRSYLLERKALRKVFLLIDANIGPSALDLEMLYFLRGAKLPFTVLLTKTDKTTQSIRVKTERLIAPLADDFLFVSAKSGLNLSAVRGAIKNAHERSV